jgi:hypothetical protein
VPGVPGMLSWFGAVFSPHQVIEVLRARATRHEQSPLRPECGPGKRRRAGPVAPRRAARPVDVHVEEGPSYSQLEILGPQSLCRRLPRSWVSVVGRPGAERVRRQAPGLHRRHDHHPPRSRHRAHRHARHLHRRAESCNALAAGSCAPKPPACSPLTSSTSTAHAAHRAGVRGAKTSDAVQIDHVVALDDAWQTGAAIWTPTKRNNWPPTNASNCSPWTVPPTRPKATPTPPPGYHRTPVFAAPMWPRRSRPRRPTGCG